MGSKMTPATLTSKAVQRLKEAKLFIDESKSKITIEKEFLLLSVKKQEFQSIISFKNELKGKTWAEIQLMIREIEEAENAHS